MAVPALPADVSAGNTTSATHQNSILDHVQWWRDTRPLFKGYMWDGVVSPANDIVTATNTTMGVGNAGAFAQIGGFPTNPLINVGSFTTQGSDADPESLVVPVAGI